MFSKIFSSLLLVSTLTAGVASKPIPKSRLPGLSSRTFPLSFDNWGGFSSLDNFDNFYGSGNFDGSQHSSQVIVNQVVCHTQQIEIIQQRLVVLQEMAKRIITEQVCDVETQVIVFQQYYSSLGSFSHDIRHSSGNHVGYDSSISSHFGSMVSSDGSLSYNDWGFTGQSVGSNTVIQSGSNWVDSMSPMSVSNAYSAAWGAFTSLHPNYAPADFGSTGAPSAAPSGGLSFSVVPSGSVPSNVAAVVPTTAVAPANGTVVVSTSTA
ncbi:hypothetical protein C0991_009111 [Blastosporella zonata]|nr:hypothetical protein C0991_009111 [Blastosporella zonata]